VLPCAIAPTEVIRLSGNKLRVAHYCGASLRLKMPGKITAGASLAQVYTGWILKDLDGASHFRGFAAKLEERGLASISEAVGRGLASPYPFILAAAKLLSVR